MCSFSLKCSHIWKVSRFLNSVTQSIWESALLYPKKSPLLKSGILVLLSFIVSLINMSNLIILWSLFPRVSPTLILRIMLSFEVKSKSKILLLCCLVLSCISCERKLLLTTDKNSSLFLLNFLQAYANLYQEN